MEKNRRKRGSNQEVDCVVEHMSDIIRASEDGREKHRQAIIKEHSVTECVMCKQHRNLKKQERKLFSSLITFFPYYALVIDTITDRFGYYNVYFFFSIIEKIIHILARYSYLCSHLLF